jgi:hypothetical protein
MKNDRIKNDRIKSDRIKSGRIKGDRIKTDRIKRITDPFPCICAQLNYNLFIPVSLPCIHIRVNPPPSLLSIQNNGKTLLVTGTSNVACY